MRGRTHVAFALATWMAILIAQRAALDLVALLPVCLGALLPDIDHPLSPASRSTRMTQGVSSLVTRVTAHREATHTILAACILTASAVPFLVFYNAKLVFAVAFLFGYLSHIFADSMTVSGVRPFMPLSDLRVRVLPRPISTGRRAERVLSKFLLLAVALELIVLL